MQKIKQMKTNPKSPPKFFADDFIFLCASAKYWLPFGFLFAIVLTDH